MKDLTHYFGELTKTGESSAMNCGLEVRKYGEKRAKSSPRKRERVKIRIKNAQGLVECEVVQNKQDLIDKTPSPVCNGRRAQLKHQDDVQNNDTCSKENLGNVENGVDSVEEICVMDTPEKTNIIKNKVKEKLIALANKRGMEKRKLQEEEEIQTINDEIEEKKKLFTQESKKDYSSNGNIVNGQKRQSCSLLNYFSKATPEQIQKEKMARARVVVKAEIHQIEGNKAVSKTSSAPSTPKSKSKRKKRMSDAELILSKADQIEVVSSENIEPPPEVEVIKSDKPTEQNLTPNDSSNSTPKTNKTPRNKPKWSMKIKLDSNSTENNDIDDIIIADIDSVLDETLFTPRSQKKTDKSKLKREKSATNGIRSPKDKTKQENSKMKKSPKTRKSESPPVKRNPTPPQEDLKTEISSPKTGKLAPIFMRKNSSKELEESKTPEETLKRKPTEKLAPLFVKRRKPDPEVLAARRQFLQPDVVDLTDREPIIKPIIPEPSLFPKISHVTQLEKVNQTEFIANYTLKTNREFKPIIDPAEMNTLNSCHKIENKSENVIKEISDAEIEMIVKEIGSRCEDAMEIWERVSKFQKKIKVKKEEVVKKKKRGRPKKKLEESIEVEEEVDPLMGMVWTNKYKPTNSKEVIGNKDAVNKLKDWLEGWRSNSSDKTQSDSDDDYSDNSRSSFVCKNQVAVLMGPHGCGKTSSVYALAEEFGYSVIEVNASSRRSGKKILKDLEEATKSHRIRNHSMESFGFGAINKTDEKSSIKKSKKTLILFDDIDLVFEEDDGFANAAFQLASNTKRPIVMTCKSSFSNLSKFASQQLQIEFKAVCSRNASPFLELVSLAESRHRLPVSCAEALTINGDLRKAMLQLQYLLLSGRAPSTSAIENPRPSVWKETHNGFYRPIIKSTKQKKKSQEQSQGKPNPKIDSNILEDMANSIDNLSLFSGLNHERDVALDPSNQLPEDTLSLAEKSSNYNYLDSLSSEIYNEIIQRTLDRSTSLESKEMSVLDTLLSRREYNNIINLGLTKTISSTLDQRAIASDFLPYLRAICRAEEIRKNSNAKRGNRFYHYLQAFVTVPPQWFTSSCKVFQEKSKDKT